MNSIGERENKVNVQTEPIQLNRGILPGGTGRISAET